MTKQATDENTFKYNLISDKPRELIENNLILVNEPQTNPKLINKLEVTSLKTRIKSKEIGLKEMVLDLYNIEDSIESEKPVTIKLGLNLYQMERV